MIYVADSVVNYQVMTSMQECVSMAALTAGYSVTSPVVISNTTWLVLLLSGDIETNPGPSIAEVSQG